MLEIKVKISDFYTFFYSKLTPLYENREVDSMFFMYIEYKYNIKKYQYYLNPALEILVNNPEMELLAQGCPIQYVLGRTVFFNMDIRVNSSVLIPRPETEELVAMILEKQKAEPTSEARAETTCGLCRARRRTPEGQSRKQKKNNSHRIIRILEIGTGSGAIAIALAKNFGNVEIWATDISEEALTVAQENSEKQDTKITFLKHDILLDDISFLPENIDVIVSNPPYIPLKEKKKMPKNVVDYEPPAALYVPDANPLIFYDAITKCAKKILRTGGFLYFETYEKYQSDIFTMLTAQGFKEIELGNDINGKPRFVCSEKL